MYSEDDVQRIKSINKKLNSLFTIIIIENSLRYVISEMFQITKKILGKN
ncbi:hypothetical protein ACOL3I_10805 [Aliarcobacter butzleri]